MKTLTNNNFLTSMMSFSPWRYLMLNRNLTTVKCAGPKSQLTKLNQPNREFKISNTQQQHF